MKHLPIASKTVALLFSAALLVACSGSDTKEEEEAAAERGASPSRARTPPPHLLDAALPSVPSVGDDGPPTGRRFVVEESTTGAYRSAGKQLHSWDLGQ